MPITLNKVYQVTAPAAQSFSFKDGQMGQRNKGKPETGFGKRADPSQLPTRVAAAVNPPGRALNTIPNGSKLKSLKYCEKQMGRVKIE